MVMPRTNISKEITATVKSAYGQKIKVFDTEIPHSIRAVEATAEGKSIFAYDKSGKVAAAYEQLNIPKSERGQPQMAEREKYYIGLNGQTFQNSRELYEAYYKGQ